MCYHRGPTPLLGNPGSGETSGRGGPVPPRSSSPRSRPTAARPSANPPQGLSLPHLRRPGPLRKHTSSRFSRKMGVKNCFFKRAAPPGAGGRLSSQRPPLPLTASRRREALPAAAPPSPRGPPVPCGAPGRSPATPPCTSWLPAGSPP